ncbi:MAG: hypothetical protein HZA46_14720, partial [Planctomycetales bacterium]|nr:hypothetical protein [Planctomycetales bacterium]
MSKTQPENPRILLRIGQRIAVMATSVLKCGAKMSNLSQLLQRLAVPTGDELLTGRLFLVRRNPCRRRLHWGIESLEPRCLLSTFVVNSTDNDSDSYSPDGICDTANNPTSDPPTPPSGICTLAAAVHQANASVGVDRIEFAIPGTGVPVIQFGGLSVDDGVTIDGTTQAAGRVELRGNGEANVTGIGLTFSVNSGGSTVRGLVINDWGNSGMQFFSDNNLIVGNFIGTNSTGTAALGNSTGLVIFGSNNTIGGTTEADRNVISGNTGLGLDIAVPFLGGTTTGNRVIGNFIGTDVTGNVALGNGSSGVTIAFAQGNTIGGAQAGEGNVISANGLVITSTAGIFIGGNTATGNRVLGNRIGTNAAGTSPLGNRIGVLVNDAPNNFIGGAPVGSTTIVGNVISGNTTFGIEFVNSNATGNVVQGNLIGTNATGTGTIANLFDGVFLAANSRNNMIGGTTAAARNVISGNTGDGVLINGNSGMPASTNQIVGNLIGTDVTGAVALPNGARGIHVDQYSTGNIIGGNTAGHRNVISGNLLDGVIIALETATENRVVGNYIGTEKEGLSELHNGRNGVFILRAPDNEIGGSLPGEGNVISGNLFSGVRIEGTAGGTGATENVVLGNLIGTNKDGALPVGNVQSGVYIVNSPRNHIGAQLAGQTTVTGNTISANEYGVRIEGLVSVNNDVLGNMIGTNRDGSIIDPDNNPNNGNGLGNLQAGVFIDGVPNNRVGVGDAGTVFASNVISGNNDGILIRGTAASGNLIGDNLIGLNSLGTSPLGNRQSGVFVDGAPNNVIGGFSPGHPVLPGNIISANPIGVLISGAGATGNVVADNRIGTDQLGVPSVPVTLLGSASTGIFVQNAANNFIGQATGADVPCDSQSYPGNVIAGSVIAGVRIEGDSATGNLVRCNSIFANTGVGIDLGGDGVTPNDILDADASPNHLQNFPVL